MHLLKDIVMDCTCLAQSMALLGSVALLGWYVTVGVDLYTHPSCLDVSLLIVAFRWRCRTLALLNHVCCHALNL